MQIKLIKVSKPAFKQSREFVSMYAKRLGPLCKFEHTEPKHEPELCYLAKQIKQGAQIVVFEETSRQFTSNELASFIQSKRDNPSVSKLVFIIGPPLGLSEEVKKIATLKLGLAKATLPSDLAWVVAVEQIYRAHMIINGSSYHH